MAHPRILRVLYRQCRPQQQQKKPVSFLKSKNCSPGVFSLCVLHFQVVLYVEIAGGHLVYEASSQLDPASFRGLKPGWMFGRRVDLSDSQFRFFRQEIPILTAAAIGFLAMSHGVRYLTNNVSDNTFCYCTMYSLPFFSFLLKSNSLVLLLWCFCMLVLSCQSIFLRHIFFRFPAICKWFLYRFYVIHCEY